MLDKVKIYSFLVGLITIFLFLFVIFKVSDVYNYAVLVLMIVFIVFGTNFHKDVNTEQFIFYGIMLFVFFLHYIFSDEKITTNVIYFTTILFYDKLFSIKLSYKFFVFLILVLFAASYLIFYEELLAAFKYTNRAFLFEGFFLNANTNSLFSVCVISIILLYINNKKLKFFLLPFAFAYMLACGSRNGLLFVLMVFFFFVVSKTKLKKYLFFIFLATLVSMLCYLVFYELNNTVNFTVFGKSANSAGRATQILLAFKNFSVNMLGYGKELVDGFVVRSTGYAIHNFFINSLFALGIIPFLMYFLFIYRIFNILNSYLAKSILLAFQIYFFFEPGLMFYMSFINMVPFILLSFSSKYSYDTKDYSLLLVRKKSSTSISSKMY